MPMNKPMTEERYWRGLEKFKKRKTIASVQRELHVSYGKAKELIQDGCIELDMPSYEEAIRNGLQKDAPKDEFLNQKENLKRISLLYRAKQKAVLDYYNPKTEGGEAISMKEIKEMMAVGEEIEKKARQHHNDLLLPFDDMTDEEFNDFAMGKKKPSR